MKSKPLRRLGARFWQIGCQIAVLNREQLRKCCSPSKASVANQTSRLPPNGPSTSQAVAKTVNTLLAAAFLLLPVPPWPLFSTRMNFAPESN